MSGNKSSIESESEVIPSEFVMVDSAVEDGNNGSIIPILQLVQQLLR